MQAPAASNEDPRDGFPYGRWTTAAPLVSRRRKCVFEARGNNYDEHRGNDRDLPDGALTLPAPVMSVPQRFDALIVGGGVAGLNAALVLGRARRSVLLLDDAQPRNAVVDESHGFLTRDGVAPADLLRTARAEVGVYPTVTLMNGTAKSVKRTGGGFTMTVSPEASFAGRTLLLATGVFDEMPPITGLQERWGKSIFVCPFCDGWEVRDQRIAVYGKGREAVELAQEIRGWTTDIVVCAERDDLTDEDRAWIDASGSHLHIGTLIKLSSAPDGGDTLTFADGTQDECKALFLSAPVRQHSPLFGELGCTIGSDGLVVVDAHGATNVTGCYAAGDAVNKHHQLVIAAASGSLAAIALTCHLLAEEAKALVEPLATAS